LRRLSPGEEVLVSDLVSDVQPVIAGILKELYQIAITHVPSAWRMVYRSLEKSDIAPQDSIFLSPLLQGLREKIETLRPRLIVSTYPLYATLLDGLRRQGMTVPPLATIITDSISVHPVWIMQPSDLYCVADPETLEVVVHKMGIPASKVRVTGFPVSLQFIAPLPADAHPAGVQRILYLPSTTARHVKATLYALKPLLQAGVHLTIPVGKHGPRLYHMLRELMDSTPDAKIEIIGWTKRIPELLRTHDVVICKAGGAILHEVLAAKIPAVIDYVVPGQEEGNAEMVTSNNGGVCTHTPQETADQVQRILANGGEVALQMAASMSRVSVPDAALLAAKEALTLAA
jgi:processive 1,2-diacylglycerol beta-glucosyltransferase